ncbi:hypothetical protein B0O41_3454 [Propionibacteriaceae bacterium ES.041]|nr:hypothetical protein B0O41_3454 [Propionibacteriaceae bacterium ES.041]TDO90017.1 hypothetical protein C8D81_2907 [Enemella evansiae]
MVRSLSKSETAAEGSRFAGIADQLREYVDGVLAGEPDLLRGEELQQVITDVIRLYVIASDLSQGADDWTFDANEVAPTDVVRFVHALMKSQDLNPFDLALWFSRLEAAQHS